MELSGTAQRLLAHHVDSVGALDLLLLLHETRDRDWSAAELCAQLRCPAPWADQHLARLTDAGLLAEPVAGRHRYRRGARYGAAVDELARACRRDRGAVVRLIFARPGDQLAR